MGFADKTALHAPPVGDIPVSKKTSSSMPSAEWQGAVAQRALIDGIGDSPRQAGQRALMSGIASSPRQAVQRAAAMHASDSPRMQAQRLAVSEDPGGLPGPLRAGIEALSGMDMSGVRVHRNSSRPAQLQAAAFAQGQDIHLGPGQEQYLPHEAWHVVQQRQGRVSATLQAMGLEINDDPALEHEADVMGARAMQLERVPGPAASVVAGYGGAPSRAPVQCNYGALNPMGQARVDQQAEEKYAEKALEFELGMAQRIMGNPAVNDVVDLLVGIIKNIVDAWARHTGRTQAVTYEREFGWPPGDGYYGAFEATAQNITAVLTDKNKPLRMKLKLVYNAVRNNNLSKWLKIAAIELDRKAKGKSARDWRIKSDSHSVQHEPTGPRVRKTSTDDRVATGFARSSGLDSRLSPANVIDIANAAKRERVRAGWFASSQQDVFTHESFSSIIEWDPSTIKANKERRGGASRGLGVGEQRTLTVGDIPDLADEEIDLVLKQQGNAAPDATARGVYRGAGLQKLPWTQGGEFYDVELGSESALAASQVKARMEAGISGSTDLMFHAIQNLGLNSPNVLKGMRLALAGWMIANRDHSFYEVFKAAAAYNVQFDLDRAHPGAEYEAADNLSPMQRADFVGILPDDGVLHNVFPKDYLSLAWKDALAPALPHAGDGHGVVKGMLHAHGVSDIDQDVMTPRDTAGLQRLDEVVAAHPIGGAATAAAKAQAVRRLRQHPTFIYLGNTFGEESANRMLNTLLLRHHAGAGVTKDDHKTRLANAGIPRVILDFTLPAEHACLEAVRLNVQNAVVDVVNGIDMGPIDAALALSRLPDAKKQLVKAALIRKYHGDAQVPAPLRGGADVLNRIAHVEAVAGMEKTSATWYTWGASSGHLAMMSAGSLREATSAVPSTQGPGLYIGRTITTSSGYGAASGLRVMVVKMSGVPTINRHNAGQMARLRLLAPVPGDPLDVAGLYSSQVRSEFLMTYGTGDFARLTTNKGVTMSLNLQVAPADALRAAYVGNAGKWSGKSKTNFEHQARESKLDISGWK